ncbi:MAG TPA: hypothetical protein VFU19_14490 [Iamia sp.]|nr:hypothetical protein [Iamia sp.]
MAVSTEPAAPPGVPQPAPLRTAASPASQALALMAVLVALVAVAARLGSPMWFAAPATALLLGIVIGLAIDLRRWFAAVPGAAAALTTLVVLSVAWAVAGTSAEVATSYAPVPLVALAVFGADWRWVERLRPTTVASGVVLVVPLIGEGDDTALLPLPFAWSAVAAAALWSLRRDDQRAVPAPVPLDGAAGAPREPGAGRTALAVAASWLAAGIVIALLGLVPLYFEAPVVTGRLGSDGRVITPGPGAVVPGDGDEGGSGGGDRGPGGGGPGDTVGGGTGRDVDGDGIPDRDIDGDGIPDVDLDGDGIPDVDADGDGVPDDPAGATTDPGGSAAGGGSAGAGGGGTTRLVDDREGVRTVLRVLGVAVVGLLVAALVAVGVRALVRAVARRRALAARPWAVRLAERLEDEGARRGRARRRDEPVTGYARALADGVLAHDRLEEVGAALSAALFGPGPPSAPTAEWATRVVDEAVAANPPPSRRARRRRR